jgi:glycosyltransferase involved in cell wall biosynthesis
MKRSGHKNGVRHFKYMKLLICTQIVDTTDPTFSFMHGWLEELSKHFEKITVVCLKEGVHALPRGVEVYSLGKEKGTSRMTRAWRLFRYSLRFRREYDAVFVHQNEEYVLLCGWLWKRFGKRVYMWRNHYSGTRRTDWAALWCDKIFCTSKFSYTAKFPKTLLMPVGIDISLFYPRPNVSRDPRAVLFFARLAPSKRPDMLVSALEMLSKRGISFTAHFYGEALPKDAQYLQHIQERVKVLGLQKQITFLPGVPHREAPDVFSSHGVFVNLGASGMYDKTIFEAAACECLVLAASQDFAELVDEKFIFTEVTDLTDKLANLLELSFIDRQGAGTQLRNIAKTQSLTMLAERLAAEITT